MVNLHVSVILALLERCANVIFVHNFVAGMVCAKRMECVSVRQGMVVWVVILNFTNVTRTATTTEYARSIRVKTIRLRLTAFVITDGPEIAARTSCVIRCVFMPENVKTNGACALLVGPELDVKRKHVHTIVSTTENVLTREHVNVKRVTKERAAMFAMSKMANVIQQRKPVHVTQSQKKTEVLFSVKLGKELNVMKNRVQQLRQKKCVRDMVTANPTRVVSVIARMAGVLLTVLFARVQMNAVVMVRVHLASVNVMMNMLEVTALVQSAQRNVQGMEHVAVKKATHQRALARHHTLVSHATSFGVRLAAVAMACANIMILVECQSVHAPRNLLVRNVM